MLESLFTLSYFSLPDWVSDAVIDSIKTIPFLFFVFLFIELFEHFWANKIKSFLKASKKTGSLIGSMAASIPQCGFSVVASTLYTEGFISRGTIIAVYLATSDEAIPVLLMYPQYFKYIFPLILIKLIVAIPIGYLVDYFLKTSKRNILNKDLKCSDDEEGCCKHHITNHKKRDYFIHPIKHTMGVFVFILVLTLILNFFIEKVDIASFVKTDFSCLTPLITSLIGLIPNCAISVGLVLTFMKGAISFGAMISGLMTSSGIGLLILFKNNKDKKDLAVILSILVLTGYLTGILIQNVPVFNFLF